MKFDISYLWSGKYAKWLLLVGCILFTLMIFYEIIGMFFMHHRIQSVNSTAPIAVAVTKPVTTEERIDSSLFGEYLPPDLDESAIKQTMLNVELLGIMYAEKIEASQVIIRSAGGEERNYRLGDTIPGGAVIKRILVDGILLEYQGTLERFSLPKHELNFEPPARPLIEE